MISKPSFVLGIKQNISTLQRSSHAYRYITVIVPLPTSRSRPHCIIQIASHGATVVASLPCPTSIKLSKPVTHLSNLCKSSLRLMKLTIQMCSTASHDQNPGTPSPWESAWASTCGKRLQRRSHTPPLDLIRRSSLRHAHCLVGIVVHQSANLWNPHAPRQIHAPLGYYTLLHALVPMSKRRKTHWHHLTTSSSHISAT